LCNTFPLFSIKESVFSAEAVSGIKIAETSTRTPLPNENIQLWCCRRLAVVPEIADQNPEQPKAAGANSQDHIQQKSNRAALLAAAVIFLLVYAS